MATQSTDIFRTPVLRGGADCAGTFLFLNKPFILGGSYAPFSIIQPWPQLKKKYSNVRAGYAVENAKAVSPGATDQISNILAKVTLTLKSSTGKCLSSAQGFLNHGLDEFTDLIGKSFLLELVSAELDPKTGSEKKPISGYARRTDGKDDDVIYESEFVIPSDFGGIGAVVVENEHRNEMFLKHIVIDGLPTGSVDFDCRSWVESKFDNPQKRIFFADKSYLPSQTPEGLKSFRERDLLCLRGDGTGERKSSDRIYDYDVYNDLGSPDSKPDSARPVLGGSKKYPYPRRCRTGRPRTKTHPEDETRTVSPFYVPRDDEFSQEKQRSFLTKTVQSVFDAIIPLLQTAVVDPERGFPAFASIDRLYDQDQVPVTMVQNPGSFRGSLASLVTTVSDAIDDIVQFELPEMIRKDHFSWLRDEEFSRQTLAGLNPYSIKLISEWPLKSTLDPDVYGPPESAITTELVEQEIKDFMTVDEALEQKKLFIIDYHDVFLPYVSKVREIKGTTLYGSRAAFFLTPDGTLKPIAVELTRPPMDGKPQWKQAFTPSSEATAMWLWRFAKSHFLAHDSGYHQLVSHWLRTHCCTEPYIIATNRQLSVMHPINRLLHPHFRYTMKINALARQALINADGIIETSFSPKKYSIEISSVAYDLLWRFDKEALPADLINRGLAIEDPTAPHGLKLLIEDYPFANDGLILWDALKQWVTDYVNFYYKDASMVQSDTELQAWWVEIREKGHEDKKDEAWWPVLKTPKDLIEIVTTIVWVTSGHHAAVNFGQYTYAGYFPNRPTIARINMPCEDPTGEAWERFLDNPDSELLVCFPSQVQASIVTAILALLSNHSPDEEYLGEHKEPTWDEEPAIMEAFERFSSRLKQLEIIIDSRNKDKNLKNRSGAGVVPYELLKPISKPGVTGEGVPYSISI